MARIPRRIKHHHSIGGCQIDAQSARPGGNQEKIDARLRVEPGDQFVTVQARGRSVKPEIVAIFLPISVRNGTAITVRLRFRVEKRCYWNGRVRLDRRCLK